MPVILQGSTWKKWDLHVHTPESLVHHYPGEKEAAWEAFLSDLEALPPEFKVLGINDYLFVDGYARVLEERRKGRLANIELVLPVVELRLDKFGGILEQSEEGYRPSNWSRINLHVVLIRSTHSSFVSNLCLPFLRGTPSYQDPLATVGLESLLGII